MTRSCSYCPYVKGRGTMAKHIRSSHPEMCKAKCPECKKLFVEDIDMENHRKKKHGVRDVCKKVKCEMCTKLFVKQKDMQQHFLAKHNDITTVPSIRDISVLLKTAQFERKLKEKLSLNDFMTSLQPTEMFNDKIGEIVEKFRNFAHHNLSRKFGSVDLFKGGSTAKGTAIPGKSDLDLVFKFSDIKNANEMEENLSDILKEMGNYIDETNVLSSRQDGKLGPFAVKCTSQYGGEEFKVDLLPSFHVSAFDAYRDMETKSKYKREIYSAALVQLQVAFVKSMPPRVKDLIRLVKCWRKECFEETKPREKRRLPTSYILELITIGCWEKAGCPEAFNANAGFCAVMDQLCDYHGLEFSWTKYYDKSMIYPERPFVLDPANPFNNVCKKVNSWEEVKNVAKITRKLGYFHETRVLHGWK